MLREFDNIQCKEQHTTNPMQWSSIEEIEIMSHGKSSTATQPRTNLLQITAELRVLAMDQLPLIYLFNGYLISSFMICFPLVVSRFWVNIFIHLPRLF